MPHRANSRARRRHAHRLRHGRRARPTHLAVAEEGSQPGAVARGVRCVGAEHDARGAALDEQREQKLREQEGAQVVGRERAVSAGREVHGQMALASGLFDGSMHDCMQRQLALLEVGHEAAGRLQVVGVERQPFDRAHRCRAARCLLTQQGGGRLGALLGRARNDDVRTTMQQQASEPEARGTICRVRQQVAAPREGRWAACRAAGHCKKP